jgi:hypothetical protein
MGIATQDEMQILARIARGDTQLQISKDFNVSKDTITAIKKRNPDTLALIKEQVLSHRVSMASRIIGKANMAIEKRIDDSEEFDDKVTELTKEYNDGELNQDEYEIKLRALNKLTVTELVSISKEMHAQTKKDPENPNADNNPADNQAYLVALAKALETGDEVVLERLIFTPKREVISQ